MPLRSKMLEKFEIVCHFDSLFLEHFPILSQVISELFFHSQLLQNLHNSQLLTSFTLTKEFMGSLV